MMFLLHVLIIDFYFALSFEKYKMLQFRQQIMQYISKTLHEGVPLVYDDVVLLVKPQLDKWNISVSYDIGAPFAELGYLFSTVKQSIKGDPMPTIEKWYIQDIMENINLFPNKEILKKFNKIYEQLVKRLLVEYKKQEDILMRDISILKSRGN